MMKSSLPSLRAEQSFFADLHCLLLEFCPAHGLTSQYPILWLQNDLKRGSASVRPSIPASTENLAQPF
jgi:hypothetical protein